MSDSAAQLVGAWTLVSYVTTDLDESAERYPMGADAEGILIYTADGYMSVQIARPGRARYAAGELHGGSDRERASAAAGYLAYAGPFNFGDDGVVTHLPDVSLFPNWEDRPIPRRATFCGDLLTLELVEPIVVDGRPRSGALTWRRVVSHDLRAPAARD